MIKMIFFNSVSKWCLLLFLLFSLMGCAGSGQLVKIEPAKGVTQGFILITPENPKASVILLPGGDGKLKLTGGESYTRIGRYQNNFLVRTREMFSEKGFQVAVMDATYDQFGYISISRSRKEHWANVRAVATYLKEKANVPVWLVGTSRGTDSVANIAINDPEHYEGAVFTSTVQDAVYQDVSRIELPTLVVHHSNDQCYVCSPSVAKNLYEKLIHAQSREILWFNGGYTRSKPCDAMSYHGFLGIEEKVVDAIAEFILTRSGK